MVDLESLVTAISAQPAQTQASCASMMVANGFFFAAMKAVFVFPDVLKAVLEDIQLQVSLPMTAGMCHLSLFVLFVLGECIELLSCSLSCTSLAGRDDEHPALHFTHTRMPAFPLWFLTPATDMHIVSLQVATS